MKCSDIRECLPEYQDGELEEAVRQEIASHLLACGSCRQEEAVLRRAWDLLDAWEPAEAWPDQTAAIMARVAAPREGVLPLRRLRSWGPVAGRVALLAASLLLVCGLLLSNTTGLHKDPPVLQEVVDSWDAGRNAVVIDRMPLYVASGHEGMLPPLLMEPGDPRHRSSDDDLLEEIISDQNG